MRSIAVYCIFPLLFCLAFSAQGKEPAAQAPMVVGLAGSAPFVNDSNGGAGISAEIWAKLADRMQWNYRTVFYEDVSAALLAMRAGEIDAVAGPVSITSDRAEHMAFTLPYFQSSLSILSRVEEPSFWQLLAPFFSRKFFYSVCVFLFILGVVGFLLWLAEREANPKQFPARPLRGIGNGMWCAITTMSTTGYGDVVPRTFWGRFIAGAWMVISLISATTLVAGIASSVTLTGMRSRSVQHAEDLKGQRVATLKGSTSVPFIQLYGGTVVPVETLDEGAQALKNGRVGAMVYDRPQLAYYVQVHPGMDLAISSAEYDKQGYGFAFPLSFRQVHDVNVTLLELKEDGFVDRITARWLGGSH